MIQELTLAQMTPALDKVEIPASDLRAVAASDVENVRIVTAIGEVTLNIGAMRDLVTPTASSGASNGPGGRSVALTRRNYWR
jgi:hypothetical protein